MFGVISFTKLTLRLRDTRIISVGENLIEPIYIVELNRIICCVYVGFHILLSRFLLILTNGSGSLRGGVAFLHAS
jgi:hypothetical protein